MMSPTLAFLESASFHWTHQPHGLAQAVLPQSRGTTIAIIIFQVSASGPRPGHEESGLVQVLIPVQVVGQPRQTLLPDCLAPRKLENLVLATRKP